MDEIHIRAWGRVQGVFFRRATKKTAAKLGLKGYVCNCNDGGIEICFLGDRLAAENLLAAIEKSNPLVRIDRKEINVRSRGENFSDFSIRNQDAV
ncbi:MAG: acylphosphatase [Candidatus Algichlamydia australiensis]|nr:acylphosphatase [Chlamydiales bacterium]